MKVIRSWPVVVPAGHARVEDSFERVYTAGFDYFPLGVPAAAGADILHVDWDTAVSPEDLAIFADRAKDEPTRVLVAPMREYPGGLHGTTPRRLSRPTWNCRVYEGSATRYVTPADEFANLFGFGMVYLPAKLVEAYCAEAAGSGEPFSDIGFSGWHYIAVEREARLCWDVSPVHVNYPAPGEL
jgi:hypothetical protein